MYGMIVLLAITGLVFFKDKSMKKRDQTIQKSYKREINLQTKVVKDKSEYSRKQKHKNQIKE